MKPAQSSKATPQASVDFDKKLVSFIKKRVRHTKVKFIIRESRLWNSRDLSGNTLLHIAARHNNDAIAQYLISSGSRLDVQNKSGKTPLIAAVEKSSNDTTEILLVAGAKVCTLDNSGKSALHWFQQSFGDDVQLARAFLNNLQIDCRNDDEKIATVLRDADWPLYHVVHLRNVQVTRLMLSFGLSVHARDKSNQQALHKAVRLVDVEQVELLLERGASPNAMDDAHRSPLHYLYERERRHSDGHLAILKLLIDRGAGLSLMNRSQIDVALRYGNREAIEVLLKAGLRINHEDGLPPRTTTPIHILARNPNPDAFEALDGRIFDANARDETLGTPLHAAATHGNASSVDYLLRRGADANALNALNFSPLYCALSHWCNDTTDGDRFKDCAELLLEYGAVVQIETQSFGVLTTLLDVVAGTERYDLGEMLVAHLLLRETLTSHTRRMLDRDANLRSCYESCQRRLTTIVDEATTLLDLLSVDDAVFRERYVRNRRWHAKMREFCEGSTCGCYLDRMLSRRIDKATKVIESRKEAACVLCESILRWEYASFYLVGDTIVSYLGERDVVNLLSMPL